MAPLPQDPRHQRFADLLLRGRDHGAAYLGAGFKCSKKSAQANATRLLDHPEVRAYLDHIRQAAATASVMTVQEKREFFARIKRVPLAKIDPNDPNDPNADLILSLDRKTLEGNEKNPEAWIVEKFKKLDPLKAIDLDNKLSGDDPEATAMQALATALASLGQNAGTLPQDRM